jgi:hypothetical protein
MSSAAIRELAIQLATCRILLVTYSWTLGWSLPDWSQPDGLFPLLVPESWQLGFPQAP